MKRLSCALIVGAVLALAGPTRADTYVGTIPFVNSSVDVTFTGDITGTENLTVTLGEVDLELTGTGGIYDSLTLNSGFFDLADASMSLDQGGTPLTLDITGFGFDVQSSSLTLTPTGTADEYAVAGDINVVANEGTMFEPVSGITYDFSTIPESVTATLLVNSTMTISDPVEDDDLLDLSADLRFGGEELAPYNVGGVASGTIDISSVNTLTLQGGLAAIPEPGTGGLLLLGFLGAAVLRRRR